MNAVNLTASLAQTAAMRGLCDKWIEAGASQAFAAGTIGQLVGAVRELKDHDRRFGTNTETRKRRVALARRMRNFAKALNLDDDAKVLTVLRLKDDDGPYRVEWLLHATTNRPNVSRILVEGAELLETHSGFGTVHLTRDVILSVASLLRERHRVIESVTGKTLAWRAPHKDTAEIATILTGKKVTTAAVRKALQRIQSGTKLS